MSHIWANFLLSGLSSSSGTALYQQMWLVSIISPVSSPHPSLLCFALPSSSIPLKGILFIFFFKTQTRLCFFVFASYPPHYPIFSAAWWFVVVSW
jgi:hypothetical protein